MRRCDLRRVILLLPLLTLFLLMWFVSGGASLSLLDLTPTAYSYLPFVVANPTPSVTPIPPEDLEIEMAVADGINAERAAQGLEALTLVSELTQAARMRPGAVAWRPSIEESSTPRCGAG